MPLLVNVHHLETQSLDLQGALTVVELDIDRRDEIIQVTRPLNYDLVVQKLSGNILVQGTLRITLDCQCVRCLEPFAYELEVNGTVCHLELEGQDKVTPVNDCVDLTPCLREDILLEFPRHPLCKPECRGLAGKPVVGVEEAGAAGGAEVVCSAWNELNKLKF
jgi:uncharacterized protein